MNIRTKHYVAVWFFGLSLVLIGLIAVAGCEKSEPQGSAPKPTEPVADAVSDAAKLASATEQKTCPIMEGQAINKDLFTEYKGKKVYFCCPGCKPKFEAEPEKYIAKLPQFKN